MTKQPKSISFESEIEMALSCGESFQHQAVVIIPNIHLIEEGKALVRDGRLGFVVVCATSLSFAIELYLKSMLMICNLKVPKTHNLRELYNKLPHSAKKSIEDVYNTNCLEIARDLNGHMGFTLAKGPIETPEWDDSKKRFTLPKLLVRSKDLFTSWRYVFEFHKPNDSLYQFHHFDYGFLLAAAQAMRAAIKVRLDRK